MIPPSDAFAVGRSGYPRSNALGKGQGPLLGVGRLLQQHLDALGDLLIDEPKLRINLDLLDVSVSYDHCPRSVEMDHPPV
jgi:hypothetical protein